jgi:membrane associated rhomboid family serine protease
MILLDILLAVLGGIAAHQLDEPIKRMDGRNDGWQLITRYMVGVIGGGLFFSMIIHRLRPDATRDGVMAFGAAFAGFGGGVVISRFLEGLLSLGRQA